MIKELLAALAADGKAILYSSHVQEVVEKACHRALIVHPGALVADGARTRSKLPPASPPSKMSFAN
jgi:ABC-2 type transport system ATP-binding protein